MERLEHKNYYTALRLLEEAQKTAKKSKCRREKCGAIITKEIDGEIEVIGEGYRRPPKNIGSCIKCFCEKNGYEGKLADKMCCVSAETDAIFNALGRKDEIFVEGTTMYFASIDKVSGKRIPSNNTFSAECIRGIMHAGVKYLVLEHNEGFEGKNGIYRYDPEEFSDFSRNSEKGIVKKILNSLGVCLSKNQTQE